MKKFRETGRVAFRTLIERQVLRRSIFSALSRPFPEDYDLSSEVDCVIATIKHCYIEIEIYWREETHHATIALKTHRVDPEDEEHWITRDNASCFQYTLSVFKFILHIASYAAQQ